jgi:hypothetical protein
VYLARNSAEAPSLTTAGFSGVLKRGAINCGPASEPFPVFAKLTFSRALQRDSPDGFLATGICEIINC